MAGPYTVIVDARVEKDLKKVPDNIIEKFIAILDELEQDPVHRRPGVDIKRLKGHVDIFRVRLGKYRALYDVNKIERIVKITTVVHRRKAYV